MRKITSVFLCLSLSGCATIFGKSQDIITIHSKDPEATLIVNGNEVGKGTATYSVKRGKQAVIVASKKGCSDRTVVTETSIAGVAFLNLIFLVGWIVDAATGAIHKTDPTDYTITPACS